MEQPTFKREEGGRSVKETRVGKRLERTISNQQYLFYMATGFDLEVGCALLFPVHLEHRLHLGAFHETVPSRTHEN